MSRVQKDRVVKITPNPDAQGSWIGHHASALEYKVSMSDPEIYGDPTLALEVAPVVETGEAKWEILKLKMIKYTVVIIAVVAFSVFCALFVHQEVPEDIPGVILSVSILLFLIYATLFLSVYDDPRSGVKMMHVSRDRPRAADWGVLAEVSIPRKVDHSGVPIGKMCTESDRGFVGEVKKNILSSQEAKQTLHSVIEAAIPAMDYASSSPAFSPIAIPPQVDKSLEKVLSSLVNSAVMEENAREDVRKWQGDMVAENILSISNLNTPGENSR